MPDRIEGFLEVGTNDQGEVVINHPGLKTDEHGVGHIVFSPRQARDLAHLLLKHAAEIEVEQWRQKEIAKVKDPAEVPPVDRSACVLTDGSPVTDDHTELRPDGQQKGYVVLTEAERAKGFVRPVRHKYKHNKCGVVTQMGLALAETYARDPKFYSGTFCVECRGHFPLDQFVWEGTEEQVGS